MRDDDGAAGGALSAFHGTARNSRGTATRPKNFPAREPSRNGSATSRKSGVKNPKGVIPSRLWLVLESAAFLYREAYGSLQAPAPPLRAGNATPSMLVAISIVRLSQALHGITSLPPFFSLVARRCHRRCRRIRPERLILELTRPVRTWEFLSAVGTRAGIFGNESGRVEAWVYPLKIFRDFHLRFHTEDRVLPAESLARTVIVRPESTTIVYTSDTFSVRETFFVPVKRTRRGHYFRSRNRISSRN